MTTRPERLSAGPGIVYVPRVTPGTPRKARIAKAHRALTDRQLQNAVFIPSSIEVDRRARRAKSDRLDGRKLVALLIRMDRGEATIRRVSVPSPQRRMRGGLRASSSA